MNDLVARLRQQLDDDERLIDEYERYMAERAASAGSYVLVIPPGWQPGEPFDPDRQRAEVDAKRRILDLHQPYQEGYKYLDPDTRVPNTRCSVCHDIPGDVDYDNPPYAVEFPCSTLRLLALALAAADRPGYRPEWKP